MGIIDFFGSDVELVQDAIDELDQTSAGAVGHADDLASGITDWRHIELACPLVHPASYDAACNRLGVDSAGLRDIFNGKVDLDGRWGPRAVAERLVDADDVVLFDKIPVLPITLREPILVPDDARFVQPVDGTVNDAYDFAIWRANRCNQLVELSAPSVITDSEFAMLLDALGVLFSAVEAGNAIPQPWSSPEETQPIVVPMEDGFSYEDQIRYTGPWRSLIWLDDERLASVKGRELTIIDAEKQTTLSSMTIRPGWVIGLFEERYLLLVSDSDIEGFGGVNVIDISRMVELDHVPAEVPLRLLVNGQPEYLYRIDMRTDAQEMVRIESDRPAVAAYSRDGAYALASGDDEIAVVDQSSGVTYYATKVEPWTSDVWVSKDGRLIDVSEFNQQVAASTPLTPEEKLLAAIFAKDESADDAAADRSRAVDELGFDPDDTEVEVEGAIAWTKEGWKVLTNGGVLLLPDGKKYRITFDVLAAAFSPNGARLGLLREDESLLLLSV